MNKTLLIAPMLVLAAGALHLIDKRRGDAELSRVRAEVASLSSTVEGVRKSAAEGGAPRPAPVIQVVAPAATDAPESAAPREASAGRDDKPSPPSTAEVRAHLDASFAAERADARWSRDAQSTAQTKLAAIVDGSSSVRSVECRSSMCRIETAHDDRQSCQRFVETAFMNPQSQVWNGGFFANMVAGEDGKLSMVSYLARDGEPLPRSRD